VIYLLFRRLRTPLIVLISVYSLSILGFVLIPGQDDQGNVWHMSFFHAFYFVSFMGSTIGFGEIPYEFTDAQRFWTLIAIYGTVISWLYGIGTMLGIIQDPAFRRLMTESSFARRVKNLTEPFYVICGYGDTGLLLARGLSDEGIQVVVLDIKPDVINELEITEFQVQPYGLAADASRLRYLRMAGIQHPKCKGVIALTDNDQTNLTIATAVHLLNKKIQLISRAESEDAESNISSFGSNVTINPYKLFADKMNLVIHAPGMYILFDWLTGIPHDPLAEPNFPKEGSWILCGYDTFGKTIYRQLKESDTDVTVITPQNEDLIRLDKGVKGVGVRSEVQEEAGIKKATGIIAGTANDADNLSIIMTAKEQNPDIYIAARQNQRFHSPIFEAANINLTLQRGNIIAHTIFALIRSPLMADFIRHASCHNDDWAKKVVSRIAGIIENEVPYLWEIEISYKSSLAVYKAIQKRRNIKLLDITRSPKNRQEQLNCIPLMLLRKDRNYLLPEPEQRLKPGDRLLFCGNSTAKRTYSWALDDPFVLNYLLTGKEGSGGYVWQWLMKRKENSTD
jgi:Trk K+ transport system NAD-binding subunit